MIAGRYSLKDEVGRGGMGVVWRAKDELLGRDVAVKRVGLLPGGARQDLARAAREARLAATLNHPNVVAVFDLVEQGDEQWLVMEYVESTTLAQLVADRGALSPDAAAKLLGQAADALAAAHRAGIVHRDVKPSNILVTPSGQVKLTDFGIARGDADATLTQTGMMTGSPAYLAPELASGGTAGPASDVWALGATTFHALTGRPPYDVGGNVMGALYQIVNEDPPRPENAGWLRPMLEATMTKDPTDRWPMGRVAEFLGAGGSTRVGGSRAAEQPDGPSEDAHSTAVLSPVAPASGAAAAPPREDPPHKEPGRRRGRAALLLGAAVAVLALLVLGWTVLDDSGGDEEAAGGATPEETTDQSPSPTESPTASPTESPPETAGPTAEGMEEFVTDYLAAVTTDPETAWGRLTPQFQEESGGFGGYRSWWGTIDSASLNSVNADPDAMTVSYSVTYQMTDGGSRTDDVTLQLTMEDGEYLIAGES